MDTKDAALEVEKPMETQETTSEPVKVTETKETPDEMKEQNESNKKRKMPTTVADARVHNIHGHYSLPSETVQKMAMVKKILGKAAESLEDLFLLDDVKYDTGRFIACLDAIQTAKDIAVNSLTLPHVHTESN